MSGRIARRYAEFVTTRGKLVVLVVVLATVVVAAGTAVNETGDAGIGQFEVDSPETDAADYIDANYTTDDRVVSQVVVREENALSRESLLAGLRLQQEIRADATLADPGFVGIKNIVGTAAVLDERGALPPPLRHRHGVCHRARAGLLSARPSEPAGRPRAPAVRDVTSESETPIFSTAHDNRTI